MLWSSSFTYRNQCGTTGYLLWDFGAAAVVDAKQQQRKKCTAVVKRLKSKFRVTQKAVYFLGG